MKKQFPISYLTISILLTAYCTGAELSVPNVFSDHMVLQQSEAAKVWGRADPGKKVTVRFRGNSHKAKVRKNGKWSLQIPTGEPGSEGHQLVIESGKEKITIKGVLVGPASISSTPQPVNKYPEFSWDHIPRYMHVYKTKPYTDQEIEFLAGYPLITFEKAQGTAEGSVQEGTLQAAAAVKKRNPKAKILYYKNIVIDWPGSAMREELESIEGYLQSRDGSYPVVNDNGNVKFFDISRPEVQDWWMKDAAAMLGNPAIDGVFIDANIKVLVEQYFARGKKVGNEKAQQLIEGYREILTRINTDLRPDNIILANLLRARFEDGGHQYLQHFDGSYLECFEHEVGGMSKVDYIAKGILHAQEAAKKGKILAFTAGLGEALEHDSSGIGLDELRKGIDNLEHTEDRLNFLAAMFLVIAEKHSYFYPHDGYVVRTTRKGKQINLAWMHTFPIFEKNLGPPKGSATRDGYIYTREFEHCSVWLDIENETGKLTWR